MEWKEQKKTEGKWACYFKRRDSGVKPFLACMTRLVSSLVPEWHDEGEERGGEVGGWGNHGVAD